jgi:hypothetical protein
MQGQGKLCLPELNPVVVVYRMALLLPSLLGHDLLSKVASLVILVTYITETGKGYLLR